MRKFIIQTSVFILLILMIFIIGLLLPTTPRVKESLLFGKGQKDSLLENAPSPRIILIGGSSVSMSINSQLIKDSLNLNPINTGIQAPIGLSFMLDNTLEYVKKGDVIVIAAEYHQFFGEFAYGQEELMRTIFDVNFSEFHHLRWKQIKSIYTYLPKYALSKYKPTEYRPFDGADYYSKDCFNQYGDAALHWNIKKENKIIMRDITKEFSYEIIDQILDFNEKVTKKGARLFLTYPPFEEKSYKLNEKKIKMVEAEFKKLGIPVLGKPEQYRTTNDLMFDTPYHMNKKGLDIRTQMLIKELKENGNLKP